MITLSRAKSVLRNHGGTVIDIDDPSVGPRFRSDVLPQLGIESSHVGARRWTLRRRPAPIPGGGRGNAPSEERNPRTLAFSECTAFERHRRWYDQFREDSTARHKE